MVLKLAHLLGPLKQKTNSCSRGITQFRTTSCKYKIMTSLPKYGVLLILKYGQKCKFQRVTQNLRVFVYIARDPSATEEDLSSQLGCLVGNNLFTSPESGYQLISAILRELRMKVSNIFQLHGKYQTPNRIPL